jgi:hypothetical protein
MDQKSSLTQRVWDRVQFFLCLGVVGVLLAYLTVWHGLSGQTYDVPVVAGQESDVAIAGPKNVAIRPDSPIFHKLQIVTVHEVETTDPIVIVTGVDVASLQTSGTNGNGNGNGNGNSNANNGGHDSSDASPTSSSADSPVSFDQLNDFWQFHSAELLTIFADWQKAGDDIAFTEKQLQTVEQLARTTIDAQQLAVERLERLVQIGTDTEKDLAEAKAALHQAQLESQKDVREAQVAVQVAKREKAMLARQLALEGLQPELLVSTSRDVDIIMAEVPEGMIQHVVVGQSCLAKFFSYPDRKFGGKVLSIVPVLSKELRSLRVLFTIDDAGDVLRPGMFAEVGIGVDPRRILQVPPEAVIHIGDSDYVLVRKGDTDWAVTAVQIGEQHESGVEVFSGLNDGDEVVGKGVILLKPVIAEALRLK